LVKNASRAKAWFTQGGIVVLAPLANLGILIYKLGQML
jgi:hypothetical protein